MITTAISWAINWWFTIRNWKCAYIENCSIHVAEYVTSLLCEYVSMDVADVVASTNANAKMQWHADVGIVIAINNDFIAK